MITTTEVTVTKEDLAPILEIHNGNKIFESAIAGKGTADELFRAIGRYIKFNSVFGGGVANLAGEIAERTDAFWDSDEPVAAFADRSAFVAARIYAASVAEFGGEHCRFVHRSLAQATLMGMALAFNFDPRYINALLADPPELEEAMKLVEDGYGVNRMLSDRDLFFGIGFHMGSECLADQEFNILDSILQDQWSDLVHNLKATKVAVAGEHLHPAYDWITIHTTVEVDHYAFATEGANLALKYYCGTLPLEKAKEAVLEGFRRFADVQTNFMQSLQ